MLKALPTVDGVIGLIKCRREKVEKISEDFDMFRQGIKADIYINMPLFCGLAFALPFFYRLCLKRHFLTEIFSHAATN